MNPHLNQERVEFLRHRIGDALKERLSQWPRSEKLLPVVELDVNWVRFSILNHRTKAERLKMCRDLQKPHLFDQDPLGPGAQGAQFELLKSHRGFENLKADLLERGQQEAAVVTAEGVLINGNRRTAALRELYTDHHLKAKYVRAIVLPEDASPDELRLLETELQVSERFEEEYSWVNRGFLIDELLHEHNQDFEMVAKLMRMNVRDVKEEFQKFRQVDQLVAMSGQAYMHVDFEPNESAFDELAKHINNKPANEASAVRSTYFIGTLAGCKYRDLRNLRRPDALKYVEKELDERPVLRTTISVIQADAGQERPSDVDELLSDALGPSDCLTKVDALLGFLAKNKRDATVKLDKEAQVSVEGLLQQVNIAVTQAAKEAEADDQDERTVLGPAKYLKEAQDKIARAMKLLPRARALPDWVEADFRKVVGELCQSASDLEKA